MIDLEKLKQNFTGDIDTSLETLKTFSRDASIFEITPEAVVSPKNVEDIRHLVSFASNEQQQGRKVSLTPRAAGTDMTGGSIGNSVIVNFLKYFNHIEPINGTTISVEPGVYYRDMEKVTLAKNLVMPSFPASRSICAVGGLVGNNSGGEKSLAYGQTRNYIQELNMVLADGNEYLIKPITAEELQNKIQQNNFEGQIYKRTLGLISRNEKLIQNAKPTTSKNSAGYYLWDVWDGRTFDLTKLFVGSQGTLGIITNIKFKLVPTKPYSKLLIIFVQNLTDLGNIVQEIKQFQPESFELYDKHTLRLAMRFLPDIAKKMKAGIIKLMWQFLPEALMALTGGLPKLVLLAEFTGNDEGAIKSRAKSAEQRIKHKFNIKTRIAKNQNEASKYWTVRRESFNLLRQHAQGKVSSPFVEDIIVHTNELPKFLPRLNTIFSKYPSFEYTIAGHAGDANFHIIPFVDLKKPEEHEMVTRLSEEVYNLISEFKGSITAEHNDGISHGAFLNKMYSPEVLELFRQVKKIFDPQGIFNPGKKVEATLQDFERYMRRS